MSRFASLLDQQVANEFAASQQYIAIAVHYDDEDLPELARRFYQQALEERNHAMMIVQYLLDQDLHVTIPGVEAPQSGFGDLAAPVALALEQEKRVSEQIKSLVAAAREEGDFQGEQFLQWFLKEQVEEVSSMSTMLRQIERAGDNALWIEDYLARTPQGRGRRPDRPAGRRRRALVRTARRQARSRLGARAAGPCRRRRPPTARRALPALRRPSGTARCARRR